MLEQKSGGLEDKVETGEPLCVELKTQVRTYLGFDASVSKEVFERRKKLFESLQGNLLVPEQQPLLTYASENAGDMHLFELGGTFGNILDNFLSAVYADMLIGEIRENGKNAVGFVIIDPTDVSRSERTLLFAGKKLKFPLSVKSVAHGRTTAVIPPPAPQDLAPLFDEMKKEISFYFDGVFKENQAFKHSFEEKQKCRQTLREMEERLASLRGKTIEIAQRSKSYREFTDGLWAYMTKDFLRNSICITLKQWQSGWDLREIVFNPDFYVALERFGESRRLGAEDLPEDVEALALSRKRLQEVEAYTFPFRIDRDGWIFQDPFIDLKEREVWAQKTDLGMADPLIFKPEELFVSDSVLLPQGSLLYVLDSLMYRAIPIATLNERTETGYELTKMLGGNPLPLMPKQKFQYFSIGRKTKGNPDEKKSGILAALVEGESRERLDLLLKKTAAVHSASYKMYSQPSV